MRNWLRSKFIGLDICSVTMVTEYTKSEASWARALCLLGVNFAGSFGPVSIMQGCDKDLQHEAVD